MFSFAMSPFRTLARFPCNCETETFCSPNMLQGNPSIVVKLCACKCSMLLFICALLLWKKAVLLWAWKSAVLLSTSCALLAGTHVYLDLHVAAWRSCVSVCFLWEERCAKALPQCWHLKGFSPVCVRMWDFSVLPSAKHREQWGHLKGRSPDRTLIKEPWIFDRALDKMVCYRQDQVGKKVNQASQKES